jgi:hypothetical protein
MQKTSSATAARQDAGCCVGYDACANLRKHWGVCGVSWLLRVIDHEGSPDGSKIVLKLGSQVSGVVETGARTGDKQPVALLAKMIG